MDINDWGAFIRGRWNWSKDGYEKGFPRGCQFTDVDAGVEFDGHSLIIEAKHWDGVGDRPEIGQAQTSYLRDEVRRCKVALVVFGCGPCNDPWAVRQIGATKDDDRWYDWRDVPGKADRRKQFKRLIDRATGLLPLDGLCPGSGFFPKRERSPRLDGRGVCPDCGTTVNLRLTAPAGITEEHLRDVEGGP